ncbi:MAG TPA: tetratricopeptide repeat protein [Candidatus Acidoferrum sp.]|nr:tetratricopeptide repeat protein [Candidatus Acidoferrum sp.]
MKKAGSILLCLLAVLLGGLSATARRDAAQESTSGEYLNARAGVAYVGDEACRECHEPQYKEFKKTGMGRSLSIPGPGNWPEFTKPVKFTNEKIGRTYSVNVSGGKMYHTETKIDDSGKEVYSEKHEVAFTVGSGDVGRSYLVAKGDALFVSPISYYSRIRGWDLSPGYEEGQFRSFTRPAWNLCVSCHSGMPQPIAGTRNRYDNPPFRFLAVACERCHGPGEIHVRERHENAPLRGPIDFSIVNPARLSPQARDDVCNQCHFPGDARVLRPGKTYLDFRPGTPLGNVVSVFSAPVTSNINVVRALSHREQLEMSRCWNGSNGRLGCITCHDPHVQLRGTEAAAYFRRKCLTCHTEESCRASALRRRSTSPPDNCTGCHMPKKSVANIAHSALTDHRILRVPTQSTPMSSGIQEYSDNLIYWTKSLQEPDAKPDLRALALAYYEVSQLYPAFRQRGFALLEQAAQELPGDAEIQATYGLVMTLAHPESTEDASRALQKAIDSGSKSVEVRTHLAKIRLKERNAAAALHLYKEAIEADPYYTPAYFGLAQLYAVTQDRQSAAETLKKVLKYDPGNEEARRALADTRDNSSQ